jgi:hypothetical protein
MLEKIFQFTLRFFDEEFLLLPFEFLHFLNQSFWDGEVC